MTKKWPVGKTRPLEKRLPGILGRLVLIAFLLLVLYVVSIPVGAIVFPAKVDVSCSTDSDGRLVINVQRSYFASVRSLYVYLKGPDDSSWGIDLSLQKTFSVTYGQVPRGARQVWPKERVPPQSIPPGSVFRVSVSYVDPLHLTIFGPSFQQFTFRMSDRGVPIPAPDEAALMTEIPSDAKNRRPGADSAQAAPSNTADGEVDHDD